MISNTKKTLSIILVVLFAFVSISAEDLDLIHEKSFDVSEGELFELEGYSGDVIIKSWNKDEVNVKVYGNSKAEDKVDFTFTKTSKGVFVKADKKGSSWFNWGSGIRLKFDVMVPEKFDIDASTSGGDIKLTEVEGKLRIGTSGGDVRSKNNAGNLVAKTSGGDIRLENHVGEVVLKTSGGDIRALGSVGNLEASTSGGDIDLKIEDGKIAAGTSGGDVVLNYTGSNKGVELRSSGGDIHVNLPEEFKADVYLKTSGGDVEVDFPAQSSTKIKSGRFEGTFNKGGEILQCKTSGGDIIVKTLR